MNSYCPFLVRIWFMKFWDYLLGVRSIVVFGLKYVKKEGGF